MNATKARDALVAGAQGLALSLLALAGSITLVVLAVLSIAFILLGVGVFTTPHVLHLVRRHANQRRLLAAQWSGVRIPVPYRPLPRDARSGIVGQVERCSHMLKDPATWRDMQWLLVDMTAGAVTAILAPALVLEGIFGLLLAVGLWQLVAGGMGDSAYWYAFIPVDSWGTAFLAALLGLV